MIIIILAVCLGLWAMYFLLLYSDRALMIHVKANDEKRADAIRRNRVEFDGKGGFDEMLDDDDGGQPLDYRGMGKPNLTYKLKIILGFFQISTNLTFSLNMPWPRNFVEFVSIFNIFNLDIVQWSSVNCVTLINYYSKMLIIGFIPILALLVISLFYLAPHYWKHRGGLPFLQVPDPVFHDRMARKRRRRKFWKLMLFTLFLIYPHVSSTMLRMYVCRKVEGEYYLVEDFHIRCFDSEWDSYLPANIIFIILYPFGVPAFFLALLVKYRARFESPSIRAQLGFLYDGYAKETWWFELADMSHKLILTSILGFFPQDSQMPIGMVVAILYAILILLRKPYFRKGDDRLHLFAQVELFLLMTAGYVFYKSNYASLSNSEDAVMSVFLIIVICGFVGVFIAQTLKIFKKMWKVFRANKEKEINASLELQPSDVIRQNSEGRPPFSDDAEPGAPGAPGELSRNGSVASGIGGITRDGSRAQLTRSPTAAAAAAAAAAQKKRADNALMSRNPLFDHKAAHKAKQKSSANLLSTTEDEDADMVANPISASVPTSSSTSSLTEGQMSARASLSRSPTAMRALLEDEDNTTNRFQSPLPTIQASPMPPGPLPQPLILPSMSLDSPAALPVAPFPPRPTYSETRETRENTSLSLLHEIDNDRSINYDPSDAGSRRDSTV